MRIFGTILILFSLAAFEQTIDAQAIGEIGVLKAMVEGAQTVPVGTDEKAYDAFYKAIAAHDQDGMTELFNSGRLLAPDVGTRVRVLEFHGFLAPTAEVRILEGVYKGQRGFVSLQYVSKK